MSNVITYAIQRIMKTGIPKQVLELAFTSRFANSTITLDTIESKIRQEVLDERVAHDLQLVHTTQLTIPLAQCERLSGGFYNATFRIPNELTQGKKVVSVLQVTSSAAPVIIDSGTPVTPPAQTNTSSSYSYSYSSSSSMSGTGGTWGATSSMSINNTGGVVQAMQQAVRSVSPVPLVSNALVYLVGYNTVTIKDTVITPATMQLRVNVENDENLNHIQPPYWTVFHKLLLLACKAYIYNLLIVEQDTAFIHSGGELNKVRDIIESYSDAEEQYEEYLEEAYKSFMLNDPHQSTRHYMARTGGGW